MIAAERLTTELLADIAAKISRAGVGESVLQVLRADYPGMHFSYCMDDDVGTLRPALECAGFNLYYVDGREHCLSLTTEPAAATGLLVAEVIDD